MGTRCHIAADCLKEVDSQSFLSMDHGFNAIIHVLNEVNFGASKSAEVGNVEDAIVSFGVLSVGSTDLDVVLVSD